MHILNHVVYLLFFVTLALVGCQTTPRIPVVVGMIKVPQYGSFGGQVATNSRSGNVYVTSAGYVTVLQEAEIVATLPTDQQYAGQEAVDDKGGWVYVVNHYLDSVTVIRGTEVIGNVPTVGKMPESVAVEPHSQFAFVVSGNRQVSLGQDPVEGNILVLSGTKVIDNLNLGRVYLRQIVADPVGGYVYAGSASGVVVVIKDLHEVARYVLDQNPYNAPGALISMDVNSRTGEVYTLTSFGITRFNEGQLVDSIKWGHAIHWSKLRVHPVTGDVYVTWGSQAKNGGRVLVLRNMKEIENITVGGGAAAMAIDPLTGNVYVASFEENTVTVINDAKVLATIEVGLYPYGIGVNPINGWVYVSNINDSNRSVMVLGYPEKK